MKTLSTQWLVYLVLWTVAIAAIWPGIPWLLWLGVTVGWLSGFFSSREQSPRDQIPVALLFLLAGIGQFYAAFPEEVWARKVTTWWYQVAVIIVFGLGIVSEYRRWRASQNVING